MNWCVVCVLPRNPPVNSALIAIDLRFTSLKSENAKQNWFSRLTCAPQRFIVDWSANVQLSEGCTMTFPSRDYIAVAIQTLLYERGGRNYQLPSYQVFDLLADRFELDEVARKLTCSEYYGSDEPGLAWHSLVRLARLDLVGDGSIDRHAAHGAWLLTPKGIKQARLLLGIRKLASVPLKQLIERHFPPPAC